MIKKIAIQNFKSIKNTVLNFSSDSNQVVCLIGKNGSGKTNIFKAINYFFNNLGESYSKDSIIDNSNPYVQKCSITIVFNMELIFKKAEGNKYLEEKVNVIKKIFRAKDSLFMYIGNEIELTLTQYRDGTIKWNISKDICKEVCSAIRTFFPIYYIDTRHLDLYTWDKLWEIISDLSATLPLTNQAQTETLLDDAFNRIYGDKYEKSKTILSQCFDKYRIAMNRFNFESKYRMAFSMRFGGEHFMVEGHELDYFSDGTSSFNYLKLLTSLIPRISELSCKYPVVLIDEPEIGLHNAYITEFVECLSESVNNNAFVALSTHSPKLITDLSEYNSGEYLLYKINKRGLHSKIFKMNTKWIDEAGHKVTVRETECYFSDCVVYVEGETEVQLFNHPKIQELFTNLRYVHFYSFDSNDKRFATAHAGLLNLGIPYKVLVDMDKILKYTKATSSFSFNSDALVNPLKSNDNSVAFSKSLKEKYKFYKKSKSENIFSMHQDINNLKKGKYTLAKDKQYIDSMDFNNMMKLIIEYCKYYNVLVNWSTVEGELITYENIDDFISFVDKMEAKKELEYRYICMQSDIKQKTMLMLGAFNGKNEVIDTIKISGVVKERSDGLKTEGKPKKVDRIADKTDGWVKKWISYVFATKIDTFSSVDDRKKEFKKLFPNLYSTLQIINNMI